MPSLGRKLRNKAKGALHWIFRTGQKFGVDILPRHFYSSIPDLRDLRRFPSWRKPMTMAGVRGTAIEPQLSFVAGCCTPRLRERLASRDVYADACRENGQGFGHYGTVEADMLYCFVATHRPARIVQVGAGVSTAVIQRAALDEGFAVEVICVDPYPSPMLIREGKAGRIKLIAERAQDVDLAILTEVGEGGMLFVDSTHTVKADSEVNRIILEAMPRLPRGAFIHFHDILFPYDYGCELLTQPFFGAESALLHAYLADNSRCEIVASLSMLHYGDPEGLKGLIARYRPQRNEDGLRPTGADGDFPSACYLRVTAGSPIS